MTTPTRDRSFDRIAEVYEHIRPGYPEAVFDRIIAFGHLEASARILEVGVGTGKATLPFAARGFRVCGLEPGVRLAEIARSRLTAFPEVSIEVTSFEDWVVEPAAFELAFSAQAFHWLDAERRLPRFASALQAGGVLAIFGNVARVPAGPLRDALEAAYDEQALALFSRRPEQRWYASPESPIETELRASQAFTDVELDTLGWQRALSASDYVKLLSTYSDHSTLPPKQLAALLAGVSNAIERHGGSISLHYETGLFLARRSSSSGTVANAAPGPRDHATRRGSAASRRA